MMQSCSCPDEYCALHGKPMPYKLTSTADTMTTKSYIDEKAWSKGGEYVYGDDELSEGLYALEDEAVVIEGGKYIPYNRMQEVMLLYRNRLVKYLEQKTSEAYSKGREDERERCIELVKALGVAPPNRQGEETIYNIKRGWVFEVKNAILSALQSHE